MSGRGRERPLRAARESAPWAAQAAKGWGRSRPRPDTRARDRAAARRRPILSNGSRCNSLRLASASGKRRGGRPTGRPGPLNGWSIEWSLIKLCSPALRPTSATLQKQATLACAGVTHATCPVRNHHPSPQLTDHPTSTPGVETSLRTRPDRVAVRAHERTRARPDDWDGIAAREDGLAWHGSIHWSPLYPLATAGRCSDGASG